MQFIQIDGTFTFANNIKELKIGDKIKLQPNPSNRINKDAVGAYTMSGAKIGYVPFKSNQIDLKAKYLVSKINLTQENPILLISREFDHSNILVTEPDYIKDVKYKGKIIDRSSKDLKDFKKFLERSQIEIQDIGIEYQDDNFINLLIRTNGDTDKQISTQTQTQTNRFYTVTKKYWEENVFKYDEFFKFKLIPKCIYQPFQIHRLESYVEKNYKPVDKSLKQKKFKFDNLVDNNLLDGINIESPNYGFETILSSNLKIINKSNLLKYFDSIPQNECETYLLNLTKLIVKYNINKLEYLNPENYIKYINPMITYTTNNINHSYLLDIYPDVKVGGLCYNHNFKKYCQIDLYDDLNIIEISNETTITKSNIVELLIKLVISDKKIANIYNPFKGQILRLEINELIKNNLAQLL